MIDSTQLEYRTTELDPDLLSTPFEVQTNWHVITGAACTGKTTLFILGLLPVQRSASLGPEDGTTLNFLDEWLVRDYSALGYRVMRVPVLAPQERLAFVLEWLAERGLPSVDGAARPPASDSGQARLAMNGRPPS